MYALIRPLRLSLSSVDPIAPLPHRAGLRIIFHEREDNQLDNTAYWSVIVLTCAVEQSIGKYLSGNSRVDRSLDLWLPTGGEATIDLSPVDGKQDIHQFTCAFYSRTPACPVNPTAWI